MHNIRYTKLAENDLASLFQIIYADKPNSAIDFIDRLDMFITLLEDNPYMGIACKLAPPILWWSIVIFILLFRYGVR